MDQFKARPTTYKGIAMRSRLEARVAAWLDSLGIRWTYEPHAFASEKGQYLPDFELHFMPFAETVASHTGQRVFLEVKRPYNSSDEYFAARERVAIVFDSLPRAVVLIGHEDMLERGLVEAFGYASKPTSSRQHLLVEVAVGLGIMECPPALRLPRWNE